MDAGTSLIAGLGVDVRRSRWPARLDLLQSGTGLVLSILRVMLPINRSVSGEWPYPPITT